MFENVLPGSSASHAATSVEENTAETIGATCHLLTVTVDSAESGGGFNLETDQEETFGIGNVFALLSFIIEGSEAAILNIEIDLLASLRKSLLKKEREVNQSSQRPKLYIGLEL